MSRRSLSDCHVQFVSPLNPDGSPFPIDLGTVGTFNFVVPAGEVIAGQTIVACVPFDAGCWVDGPALRPFSFGLGPATFATLTINTRAVPEPATMLLLGSGLGLGLLRRRQTRNR